MADGKWIDGLNADLPVAEAARLALAVRLEAVAAQLGAPLTVVEAVHQLRVGTRRSRAALAVFHTCFSKKDAKAAKRALRKFRQAAGAVRDWDAFNAMLQESNAAKPAHDFLLGYALGQRAAAQAVLAETIDEGGDFRNLCETFPDRAAAPDDKSVRTFGDLAVMLDAQFAAFTQLVHTASHEPAQLHQVRILGKRLRYSIELFVTCFEPPLKERIYPAVEALQELLGGLQDASVAVERLESLRELAPALIPKEWLKVRPGLVKLLQSLRAKVRAGRKRFEAWRRDWEAIVEKHPLHAIRIAAK